jgi:NADH-quinone oxidoreductase subunit E
MRDFPMNGPVLTEQIKRDIETHVDRSWSRQAACIEALMLVEKHYGWVSDESMREVAEYLDMTTAELEAVATFYNHIYRRPVGRHVILVCDSVSCWIMGYEGVRDHLASRLGIGLGETTPDERFTILPVQCLGACDKAPAMMIDGRLYTNLTPETIDNILESHR